MPSARSPWRRPALWFLLTTALASGCDLSTKSWAGLRRARDEVEPRAATA